MQGLTKVAIVRSCWSLCLSLYCATVVAVQTKSQPSDDWPLFRGNTQSTGVAKSKLPMDLTNLDVLWEFKVPKGAFEGTAAIVTDPTDPAKQVVYIGDLDGKLFAIDLATGAKVWEFASEIGFVTAPAVRDGSIYIGDIDGVFYCLNSAGKKVWSFSAEAEINSSANFHGDNVLVGSQDSRLYAINLKTGAPVWKYESPDQIRCSVTVAEDRAFVAGCDGYFHIIELNSGTEVGKTDIRSPTGATPAALRELVFFGNEQGDFFAIDSKTIETKWVFAEPQSGNSIRCSAAVNEQHVVFGGRNRVVYSLDPQTGAVQWKVTLKAKIDASPVIVGERVLVASTDGRLLALSLKDGAIEWEKQFQGGITSSPAVAFGKLVIATDRGVVYCLGEKPPVPTVK